MYTSTALSFYLAHDFHDLRAPAQQEPFFSQRHGQVTDCDWKHLYEHPCFQPFPWSKWRAAELLYSWWHRSGVFSHPWCTLPFSNGRISYSLCSEYIQVFGNRKKSISKYLRETKNTQQFSVVTIMYRRRDQAPYITQNIDYRHILFPCCSWGMEVLPRCEKRKVLGLCRERWCWVLLNF